MATTFAGSPVISLPMALTRSLASFASCLVLASWFSARGNSQSAYWHWILRETTFCYREWSRASSLKWDNRTTVGRARFPVSPKLDNVPSNIVIGPMSLRCLGKAFVLNVEMDTAYLDLVKSCSALCLSLSSSPIRHVGHAQALCQKLNFVKTKQLQEKRRH